LQTYVIQGFLEENLQSKTEDK